MLNLEKAEQWNLSVQANLLKRQLQHINSVGEKALKHDINVLQTAARDFAVSLAHVYIGKVNVFYSIHYESSDILQNLNLLLKLCMYLPEKIKVVFVPSACMR